MNSTPLSHSVEKTQIRAHAGLHVIEFKPKVVEKTDDQAAELLLFPFIYGSRDTRCATICVVFFVRQMIG